MDTSAIVTVGGGRGFVVEHNGRRGSERFIITAAHCLPHLPPACSFMHEDEATYSQIIGRLGEAPTVTAACYFVDPVADVAILGQPDGQSLYDEWRAYDALTEEPTPLAIADRANGPAWLLSLDSRPLRCMVRSNGGPLWLYDVEDGIRGGMSGSPILSEDGAAIGVVVSGNGDVGTEGGPCPRLTYHLPGWLLRDISEPAEASDFDPAHLPPNVV